MDVYQGSTRLGCPLAFIVETYFAEYHLHIGFSLPPKFKVNDVPGLESCQVFERDDQLGRKLVAIWEGEPAFSQNSGELVRLAEIPAAESNPHMTGILYVGTLHDYHVCNVSHAYLSREDILYSRHRVCGAAIAGIYGDI